MPTLVLVDGSLSMLRPIRGGETIVEETTNTRRALATAGISHFFHLLQSTSKLEFVSFAKFSAEVTLVQSSTKDFSALQKACTNLELDHKSLLLPALKYITTDVAKQWCHGTFCQLFLLTDGLGFSDLEHIDFSKFFPLKYDSFFHLICLSPEKVCEASLASAFSKVANCNDHVSLHFLERPTLNGVQELFAEITQKHYAPFYSVLRCGTLSSSIQLYPSPYQSVKFESDFEVGEKSMDSSIEIVGFLKPAELGNPLVVSRHIILPLGKLTDSESETSEKEVPNFCILLHGSFKVENRVAVCLIGPDWYGGIHYLGDQKKSSLVLYCFEPGHSMPWLGKLGNLQIRPYMGRDVEEKSPFPVSLRPKPSYALNLPCWVDGTSILSDIQKLLRYARKIPERQGQFYQELNRIFRQCLAIGFTSLIEKLVKILEKEQKQTPNAEAKKHLAHAVQTLNSGNLKYEVGIKPLK